jgi:hypothetical protein
MDAKQFLGLFGCRHVFSFHAGTVAPRRGERKYLVASAGFVEEHLARLPEPDGFCAVLEQRDAKFILKIANLPAQGRLRNVQSRRRARHVLLLGDGYEITQVAEFHTASIPDWHSQPSNKAFSAAPAFQADRGRSEQNCHYPPPTKRKPNRLCFPFAKIEREAV